MRYKAPNVKSYASELQKCQRYFQKPWTAPEPVPANHKAIVEVEEHEIFRKHLEWFFKDKYVQTKHNQLYKVVSADIHKDNDPFGWATQYTIYLHVVDGVGNMLRAYANIRLDRDQKMEDMYDRFVEYIMNNDEIRIKSKEDVTEAELVLYS